MGGKKGYIHPRRKKRVAKKKREYANLKKQLRLPEPERHPLRSERRVIEHVRRALGLHLAEQRPEQARRAHVAHAQVRGQRHDDADAGDGDGPPVLEGEGPEFRR